MSATDLYPAVRRTLDAQWTQISRSYRNHVLTDSQTTTGSRLEFDGSIMRRGATTVNYVYSSSHGRLPPNAFNYSDLSYHKYYEVHDFATDFAGTQSTDQFTGVTSYEPGRPSVLRQVNSVISSNLYNKVRQKVLSKLKDQELNLAQVWAERDQTMRLLGDNLRRIAKVLSNLKRGNFSGAAGALGLQRASNGFDARWAKNQSKAISRGWLELQYGWMPLLSDIYGASQVLEKLHKRKEYVALNASAQYEEDYTETEPPSGGVQDSYHYTSKITHKVGVKFVRSSNNFSTLSSLGLTNPAVIAWELLPFSFVVDWAVPIGTWLNQFDSAVGWLYDSGYHTTFSACTFHMMRVKSGPMPQYYVKYDISGQKSAREITCERSVLNGVFDMYSLPYFKNPLSLLHASEGLALLAVHKR